VNLVNDTTRRLVAEPIASCLSNHPLRPHQHIRRNCQADLLRRFQIDDELELLSPFQRQISGLSAFQDLVHDGRGAPAQVAHVRSVRQQASRIGKMRSTRRGRQALAYCQLKNALSVLRKHRIFRDQKRVSTALHHISENLVKDLGSVRLQTAKLHLQCTSLRFDIFGDNGVAKIVGVNYNRRGGLTESQAGELEAVVAGGLGPEYVKPIVRSTRTDFITTLTNFLQALKDSGLLPP